MQIHPRILDHQPYNTDFDTWHVTSLNLYNGKGDSQNLKNFSGICLNESKEKIMSIIFSNYLLKHLNEIGDPSQCGHIDCQEAQQTIK
jgi:hypothetical protein